MNVTRVATAKGSRIEPPLDQTWDEHTQLTWHAAVVTHDTGIPITVHSGGFEVDGKPTAGYYNLVVGNTSSGPHTFRGAWSYLNGVETGAQQNRRPATA